MEDKSLTDLDSYTRGGGIHQSINIEEIGKALATAQSQMTGHATRNAKNPHFQSDYATLDMVIDAVREPLNNVGITFVQGFDYDPRVVRDHIVVWTKLIHTSGQWLGSKLFLTVEKPTSHSYVSATTYGRRVLLASMCGIHQKDDDGNEASIYRATPQEVVQYDELVNHKAFTGKKTRAKDEWTNATTMSGVHSVLNRMQMTVDADKPKTKKGAELVVNDDGSMGFENGEITKEVADAN